jgi:enoyl-CoA hydratase
MTQMHMYENLLVEKQNRIAFLKINRPAKMNALNVATRNEILAALDELQEDAEVRVVIVTGVGEKAFIAGADIGEFAGMTALTQRDVMTRRRAFDAVETFPKPVIAMINGFCLGGGLELALGCDIRMASENAKLGQPEINLGVIPGGGGTQRLARLVGEGKAMEMILSGDMISAQEALALGLINHVFPSAELEAKTLALATKISEKSPVALRMAKEAVKTAARSNLSEGLQREVDLFALCFASEDKEEGVRAFLEKRKPNFVGR